KRRNQPVRSAAPMRRDDALDQRGHLGAVEHFQLARLLLEHARESEALDGTAAVARRIQRDVRRRGVLLRAFDGQEAIMRGGGQGRPKAEKDLEEVGGGLWR